MRTGLHYILKGFPGSFLPDAETVSFKEEAATGKFEERSNEEKRDAVTQRRPVK